MKYYKENKKNEKGMSIMTKESYLQSLENLLKKHISKEEINDYFKQNQKKFIENKDWQVREAVAKQGYGLDTLIHDEKWQVRIAVAEQNYGLDTLIHDEYWEVRKAVAEQGYGLDILINDEDWYVRSVAQRMLECNISEY